jgi:hypothetical protein
VKRLRRGVPRAREVGRVLEGPTLRPRRSGTATSGTVTSSPKKFADKNITWRNGLLGIPARAATALAWGVRVSADSRWWSTAKGASCGAGATGTRRSAASARSSTPGNRRFRGSREGFRRIIGRAEISSATTDMTMRGMLAFLVAVAFATADLRRGVRSRVPPNRIERWKPRTARRRAPSKPRSRSW